MPEPAKCVYCRAAPVAERYKPFCSERCKMADLGRWLQGDYAVPAEPQIDNFEIDNLGSGDLEIDDLSIDANSGDDK
jgi:endogenous inhibitor of DNA gyrase (YacG/DUF329 family)